MKVPLLLLLAWLCIAVAEKRPSNIERVFARLINVANINRASNGQKKSSPPRQGTPRQARPRPSPSSDSPEISNEISDDRSIYHYSWEHVPTQFSWPDAIRYCKNLGPGWEAISINSRAEDALVDDKLRRDNIKYIWTGGVKRRGRWQWPPGRGPFVGFEWSHSGGLKIPQPDNRAGREDCLSVLNNFYGDGVHWHDVQCHHKKEVICERDDDDD